MWNIFNTMIRWLFKLLSVLFLLTLPFILLIRGAVFLHINYNLHAWIALVGGMVVTIVLLVIYFSLIYRRITGKLGKLTSLKRRTYVAVLVVAGFAGYAIMYISGENVKYPEVKKEYLDLHPILRLGMATIITFNPDVIITDAGRLPEDYRKMGLPTSKRSLHYKQKDGYTHAVDIRTKGYSELRNKTLEYVFRLMGFRTLRHVGTADHLHISLMSHDMPNAK